MAGGWMAHGHISARPPEKSITTATQWRSSGSPMPSPTATASCNSAIPMSSSPATSLNTTQYPFIDIKNGGSVQGEIAALNNILDKTVYESSEEGGTLDHSRTRALMRRVGGHRVPRHGGDHSRPRARDDQEGRDPAASESREAHGRLRYSPGRDLRPLDHRYVRRSRLYQS